MPTTRPTLARRLPPLPASADRRIAGSWATAGASAGRQARATAVARRRGRRAAARRAAVGGRTRPGRGEDDRVGNMGFLAGGVTSVIALACRGLSGSGGRSPTGASLSLAPPPGRDGTPAGPERPLLNGNHSRTASDSQQRAATVGSCGQACPEPGRRALRASCRLRQRDRGASSTPVAPDRHHSR